MTNEKSSTAVASTGKSTGRRTTRLIIKSTCGLIVGMKAISKAIQEVGAKAIADACDGISVQAVHKWADGNVPADRCPTIERLTSGAVRCEELRPDVDWAVLRGTERKTD